MKIGIELRQIVMGASGGITQALKGVLEALFALPSKDEFLLFCTIYNRGLFTHLPPHVKAYSLPTETFFREIDRIGCEEGMKVLFRSYPMEDDLIFPLSRQIFFVPDIQHEVFPDFFSPVVLRARRLAANRALAAAGAIATLTDYTRQTLREHAWTRCQDIFIVSPALQAAHQGTASKDLSPKEQALIPSEDFFLYPGNLWPHKNHRRVLQAFRRFLSKDRRSMRLVLTGHPTGWAELQSEFPDVPVCHLGFVSPQVMRALFERARALVFFSLYEGFGIPLLEAFSAGTPVVCSNTTSLPEVGRDAILTCDPTDVEAMSDLMVRIVQDDGLRTELVSKGRKRLRAYSWDKSARKLLKAMHRAAITLAPAVHAPSITRNERDRPLVSIITPSFNQGRFLKRTIESVLKQSYPRIEYIVVDGGSTDESLSILKSYGRRFKWISEPDGGQADAINKGFTRSQGTIQTYLNSDDVLLPGAVERVVDYFREHPDIDMVYGQADYIDEEDRVIGLYRTAEYSFERMMQDCCVCQPAAFWQKRIAEKVGPFNPRLHYVMDYEYWLRMDRLGGRLAHLPERLAASRLYPETKTLSSRDRIFKEIFQICHEQGGYVDLNYFFGLWHHLIWERKDGWPTLLRRLSSSHQRMARLHHAWYHRHQFPPRRMVFSMGQEVKRRVIDRVSLLRRSMVPIQVWTIRRDGRNTVFGYWSDNWLEPSTRIYFQDGAVNRYIRLAGIPPVDMTLTVRESGAVLKTFLLRGNQFEVVEFAVPGKTGQLSLEFSQHIVDVAQRRLSFQIIETNLFSEQDAFFNKY
jgi:glycosyltransferase involved in cell wall biosynthesis